MAKYDGLIIPRSYNDYINKSDPVSVQQALALTGVMDDTPTAGSSKPVKSSGLVGFTPVDEVTLNNMHSATSNAVYNETKKIKVINGSTLVGNGTYILKKIGKLVTLDIQGMIIPTTQGDFIAMVLPAEFLPNENITAIGCYGGGSYNYDNLVCFGIQTNGNILSYPYQNFTSGIQQLHACWVTSN